MLAHLRRVDKTNCALYNLPRKMMMTSKMEMFVRVIRELTFDSFFLSVAHF